MKIFKRKKGMMDKIKDTIKEDKGEIAMEAVRTIVAIIITMMTKKPPIKI